jgi:hypothetical protein
MTRSALSSYPASSAPAASRWACRSRAVNPSAVAGRPTPAQNASSSGSHSSHGSRFARQSAYSPAPVTAMSPVRSSSARYVNTIASKCRRTTVPGWRRSVTARRQFPDANARPESASWPSAGGGSGMWSRRAECQARACSRAVSTEASLEVATRPSLPAKSNMVARSMRKNRWTSTS